jgi:hypothetical protein
LQKQLRELQAAHALLVDKNKALEKAAQHAAELHKADKAAQKAAHAKARKELETRHKQHLSDALARAATMHTHDLAELTAQACDLDSQHVTLSDRNKKLETECGRLKQERDSLKQERDSIKRERDGIKADCANVIEKYALLSASHERLTTGLQERMDQSKRADGERKEQRLGEVLARTQCRQLCAEVTGASENTSASLFEGAKGGHQGHGGAGQGGAGQGGAGQGGAGQGGAGQGGACTKVVPVFTLVGTSADTAKDLKHLSAVIYEAGKQLSADVRRIVDTCTKARRKLFVGASPEEDAQLTAYGNKMDQMPLTGKMHTLTKCVREMLVPHFDWLTGNVQQHIRVLVRIYKSATSIQTMLRTHHDGQTKTKGTKTKGTKTTKGTKKDMKTQEVKGAVKSDVEGDTLARAAEVVDALLLEIDEVLKEVAVGVQSTPGAADATGEDASVVGVQGATGASRGMSAAQLVAAALGLAGVEE